MKPGQVYAALAARYARPEWFFFREATFEGRRMDALAVGVYRSRGNLLLGFEVKVSRADWLREVARPEKADPLWRVVDGWYVAAARGVVAPEELPNDWGLLEVGEDGAVVETRRPGPRTPGARRPPPLRSLRPRDAMVERAVMIRLLLKLEEAGAAATSAVLEGFHAADEARLEALKERARREVLDEEARAVRRLEVLQEDMARFEEASGLKVRGALGDWGMGDPARVGAAVRAVLRMKAEGATVDAILRRARALIEAGEWLEASLREMAPAPAGEEP